MICLRKIAIWPPSIEITCFEAILRENLSQIMIFLKNMVENQKTKTSRNWILTHLANVFDQTQLSPKPSEDYCFKKFTFRARPTEILMKIIIRTEF